MSEEMLAAVHEGPRQVALRRLPLPAAEVDDEVAARVCFVGLCRTDFQIAGQGTPAPLVMGHEVVCQVPGDSGFYAVNNLISCRRCDYCRHGQTSHCTDLRELGVNAPGGYAEWLHTPAGRCTGSTCRVRSSVSWPGR